MNYKNFIDNLKRTNFFEESLPTKTIYKRLRHILAYAIRGIDKYDIGIVNTALSNALYDKINNPFFDYIVVIAKIEVDNNLTITLRNRRNNERAEKL